MKEQNNYMSPQLREIEIKLRQILCVSEGSLAGNTTEMGVNDDLN